MYREQLIRAGDVYAPRYGRLALTVPSYREYILAHYGERRADASVELTPLAQLRQQALTQGINPD